MTKLQILRGYNDNQKASSWLAMGSLNIQDYTQIFNTGCLYRISTTAGGPLAGCLIYCDQEFIGQVDWLNAECIDGVLGYITFGHDIISPNFYLMLTAEDLQAQIEAGLNPSFVPFQEEFQDTGVVQISDSDYRLCTVCLGAPFITDDELEYSREDIINLAIKPSLEEYFKWFPKVKLDTYTLSSSDVQDIEFPTGAYDIVHWDIQQAGANLASGAVTNTLLRSFEDGFYGAYSLAGVTGNYFGNRAPKTMTSNSNNYLLARAATQGLINYSTRSYLDKYIDENGKKHARFYSTKGGVAEIYWAIQTWNFNEVEFARKPELYKLCNANVKNLFATLRRQAKGDIPGAFDYDKWIAEAKTEIEEVRKDWMALVKYAGVLRGSL